MNRLIPSSAITPGTVVAFRYNGGTNPGDIRVVSVTDVDGTHIKGNDLRAKPDSKGQLFRDFLRHKLATTNVELVANESEEVVDPVMAFPFVANLPIDLAMRLYLHVNPDRQVVGYNDTAKVLIVRKPDIPCIRINITNKGLTLEFVNDDGKSLGLTFDSSTLTPTPDPIVCRMKRSDLEEFATRLHTHLLPPPNSDIAGPSTSTGGWEEYVAEQAKAGNPFYANSNA